jgi:hypothetical protein
MPRIKDHDISDRLAAAKSAKKAMLARFNARPGDSDPAVVERKASRLAASQAREAARIAKKESLAAEKIAREQEAARLALEMEEREATERRAEADREVALLAEQKATRDARYAARKSRRR